MKSKVNKTPQTVKDAAWDKVLARHGNPAPPAAPKAAPKAPSKQAKAIGAPLTADQHRAEVSAVHAKSIRDANNAATERARTKATEHAKHAGERARFVGQVKGAGSLAKAHLDRADAEADAAEKAHGVLSRAALLNGEKRRKYCKENASAISSAVNAQIEGKHRREHARLKGVHARLATRYFTENRQAIQNEANETNNTNQGMK
jgi:hypothetical protein